MEGGFRGERWFCSNFYPSTILYNGITFRTSEHFYQACKTLSEEERKFIIYAKSPTDARTVGRSSSITVRHGWEKMKFKIMWIALNLKFRQNPYLIKLLLSTDNDNLVETNTWHDNDFGNCICKKCKNKEGKNMLGKLLMLLRYQLRKERN